MADNEVSRSAMQVEADLALDSVRTRTHSPSDVIPTEMDSRSSALSMIPRSFRSKHFCMQYLVVRTDQAIFMRR